MQNDIEHDEGIELFKELIKAVDNVATSMTSFSDSIDNLRSTVRRCLFDNGVDHVGGEHVD